MKTSQAYSYLFLILSTLICAGSELKTYAYIEIDINRVVFLSLPAIALQSAFSFKKSTFLNDQTLKTNTTSVALYTEHKSHDVQEIIVVNQLLHESFVGNLTAVQNLVASNVDVNTIDRNGNTALILASYKGHKDIVKILLHNKADVNIIGSVLKHKVKVDHVNFDGFTALMRAAEEGHVAIVESLLKNGASIYNVKDTKSNALILASAFGYIEVVDLILNNIINEKQTDNKTPRLSTLLKSILDEHDANGITPLLATALEGHTKIAKLLLTHGADIHKTNRDGQSALLLASYQGHIGVVELLLEYNATINHKDDYGFTPILASSERGHSEIGKLLIMDGADIHRTNRDYQSALFVASFVGHLSFVDLLLKYNASVNDEDEYGVTPLLATAEKGHTEIAKLLIKHGADIHKTNRQRQSALLVASHNGNLSYVELLLHRNASANDEDEYGVTPLLATAEKGHTEIAKLLIKHGADIHKTNRQRQSALLVASHNGNLSYVELLLHHNASANDEDEYGVTPLLATAEKGHTKIAKLLIDHGANFHKKFQGKLSALYIASNNGHLSLVKLLLDYKATVDDTNLDGTSPLLAAAQEGHTEIAKLLIASGADIYKKDVNYHSSLFIASREGHLSFVQLLLNNNATVDDEDDYGTTPLLAATQRGNTEIVKLLIAHGADIYKRNDKNENARRIAHSNGHFEIVELIKLVEKRKIDNRQINEDGTTSLMDAAVYVIVSTLACGIVVILIYSKYFFKKNKIKGDDTLIHNYWEILYNTTTTPLLLQNVWGCDKKCQPYESGFFRLLNFRGKLHSLIHVQELSPNCNGCLFASRSDVENYESTETYLQSLLLLEYINHIAKVVSKQSTEQVNPEEAHNFRKFCLFANEKTFQIESLCFDQVASQLENVKSKLTMYSINQTNFTHILCSTFDKRNSILLTEPKIICSILGLNEIFENHLLELDIEFIEYRGLPYILNCWLENTVQAIEETDRSISLYDCMLRIGLSEEKVRSYISYLSDEFINMYSLFYWISKYFEGKMLLNPLTTDIPITCIFEDNLKYNVWESQDIQRTDYVQNFTIKKVSLQSPKNFTDDDYEKANTKVKKFRKKFRDGDFLYYYHATSLTSASDIIQNGILLKKGNPKMDFSDSGGFYVINNFKTAMEWTRRFKEHNSAQAVIIYKVLKKDMENGLKLLDLKEWKEVITACRKGFMPRSLEFTALRKKLGGFNFIEGLLCSNGPEVARGSEHEIYEDGTFRPIQTCIVNKDFAERFGSHSNICGIVIFRNVSN